MHTDTYAAHMYVRTASASAYYRVDLRCMYKVSVVYGMPVSRILVL